jgi:hypothetical protein
VRQSPIGPNGPRRDGLPPRTSSRRWGGRWLPCLAVAAALGSPATLWAQETTTPAAGGSLAASSTAAPSLARYFPKDNLVFYFEFSGVDAHADAWNKTAAYKMLTETPLGEMLEAVGAQLVDKVVSNVPGHKLDGKDFVVLWKHAAHRGLAIGFHAKPFSGAPTGDALIVTVVIRGAASKEARGLWGRVMGMTMAGGAPQLEKRGARTVVVVPPARPATPGSKDGGRTWWAENDDVVFCWPYPWGTDGVMAALDGKVPSAVDHPVVKELSARDGTFEPVGISFVDVEHAPEATASFSKFLANVREKGGIKQLAFRFGFDDDALMREIRIVAPKPRKPFLALLDQPGFDGKALMPLPEGIESFLELSIDPNALIDSIAELWPAGGIKEKVEHLSESAQRSGKIDFRKDFLGHIGPRMIVFVAPDKSATVGSFETNWLQGINSAAAASKAALEHLPKLTLVAEVSQPKSFARALEGAINALNHELTAKTAELLDKEEAGNDQPAAGAAPNPGGGRAGGARAGGGAGGGRGTRKKSPSARAPQFRPMQTSALPDPTKVAYLLMTPSDSPLKTNLPNFRPVIKFEGRHLVIAVDSDSANAALKVVQRKDWKPSEDLQKAADHLPPKMVVLGVTDPREVMPAILASLPGTMQSIINSVVTVTRARAANAQQGGANPPGAGPGPGPGGMPGRAGGRMMAGGPGGPGAMAPGGPGGRGAMAPGYPGAMAPGGPGGPGAGGPGAPGGDAGGTPPDAMVELKVDSEKLPKADDLRSRYFLNTVAITVNDQDVRLITRQAFVSPLEFFFTAGFIGGFLPAFQSALHAQGANNSAAGAEAPAAGPGQGPPAGMPGGRGGPGRGPGMRGRGGRGGPGG